MQRISDAHTPRISKAVQPIDRVRPLKRLKGSAEDSGGPFQPPYGVVDRVTLSPEGRAMAQQQRAAQPAHSAPQLLTYGPGRLPETFAPLLPENTGS